jgi:hypothetical protein
MQGPPPAVRRAKPGSGVRHTSRFLVTILHLQNQLN